MPPDQGVEIFSGGEWGSTAPRGDSGKAKGAKGEFPTQVKKKKTRSHPTSLLGTTFVKKPVSQSRRDG